MLATDLPQIQRDTKVRKLDVARLGRENVRRFQVAVHDVVPMQVVQALEDLDHVRCHEFLAQPSAKGLEDLPERSVFGVSVGWSEMKSFRIKAI